MDSWRCENHHHFTKTFVFSTYMDGIKFVTEVAKIAEAQNHHPSINIDFKKVTVTIWSRDINGISERDHQFIDACNRVSL